MMPDWIKAMNKRFDYTFINLSLTKNNTILSLILISLTVDYNITNII